MILLGFSTGARLLFSCLEHLAQHGGEQALGLVESCFMVGAAVPADPVRWQAARQVVSHRLVNGYKRDDLILMLLFRANSLKVGKVAGLEVNQLHSPVFFASLSLHDMCRVCVRFALLNLFFSSFAESSSSSPSTRHRHLQPVANVPGVENLDVGEICPGKLGHNLYRTKAPEIFAAMGCGCNGDTVCTSDVF